MYTGIRKINRVTDSNKYVDVFSKLVNKLVIFISKYSNFIYLCFNMYCELFDCDILFEYLINVRVHIKYIGKIGSVRILFSTVSILNESWAI
jgi:hypothetical protein